MNTIFSRILHYTLYICTVITILIISTVLTQEKVGAQSTDCEAWDPGNCGYSGYCHHDTQFPGSGCTGAQCDSSCCTWGYDCVGVSIPWYDFYRCCNPQVHTPVNRCWLENNGDLHADCYPGLVCPLSPPTGDPGNENCAACSSGFTGMCYKRPNDGLVINQCCGGYMCPDNLDNGATPCIRGDAKVAIFLRTINGIVLPIVVLLGTAIIILNGYKLMTSGGDPTKLQEGKDGLTSAIIGLLFVLMAVSILRVIIKALITGTVDPFSQ